jgi:hypothetical protein
MNQDVIAQQDSLAAGGGNGSFSTTTGYATGTICQRTGNYQAENKYLRVVVPYSLGQAFLPGPDGKKTIWYALAAAVSTSSTSDGSFNSVKVQPGTV